MLSYILALIHAYLTTPPTPPRSLVLGTRDSLLALAQTTLVQTYLNTHHPQHPTTVHSLKSSADKDQLTPLHQFDAKGLWTEELEHLLLKGEVDLIVHCLKDMPTTIPESCEIGAILEREDPRDALIIREGLEYKSLSELPPGAAIGTSSVRRMAQLKRAYPHLEVIDLRGNVPTRCRKVDDPSLGYTGAILAAAGLKRLGLEGRVVEYLSAPTVLYAVGQGALAIEVRKGDEETLELLKGLRCEKTTLECMAERSLMRTLQGGCSVPIGVQTTWSGEILELVAVVVSMDGEEKVAAKEQSPVRTGEEAEALGKLVAAELVNEGAGAILEKCTAKRPTTEAEL